MWGRGIFPKQLLLGEWLRSGLLVGGGELMAFASLFVFSFLFTW